MQLRPIAVIVNPRGRSMGGNRVTGLRWSAILRQLGWRVRHGVDWDGRPADLLVALHAFHSASAVERFAREQRGRPIVVVATGTDVHGEAERRATVEATFERATRIVVLQSASLAHLPPGVRARARVIHQSVHLPPLVRNLHTDRFDAVVVANLRAVKDPLLAARASRLVGAGSKLHVTLVGALETDFDRPSLEFERSDNPRFTWTGPLSHRAALQVIANSHVLVSSSRHEGGPTVVSEALALRVPVLATNIPGHVGLLGADYQGLFESGDEVGLARALERVELDPELGMRLSRAVEPAAERTRPAAELAAWRALLAELA